MTYFILQTLFWLLAAFILGLILGRLLKRLVCNRNRYRTETGPVDFTNEDQTRAHASYTSTADKLAFRERGDAEDIALDNNTPDSSLGAATKGAIAAGTAATVGAVSHALSDHDENHEKNDEEVEEVVKSTETTDIDDTVHQEHTIEETVDKGIDDDTELQKHTFEKEEQETATKPADEEPTIITDSDTVAKEATEAVSEVAADADDTLDTHISEKQSVLDTQHSSDATSATVNPATPEEHETDTQQTTPTKADETTQVSIAKADDSSTDSLAKKLHATDEDNTSTPTDSVATAAAGAIATAASTDSDTDTDTDTRATEVEDAIESNAHEVDLSGIGADNLQIIEGIGPAMQETLNKNGIYTWHDLAALKASELLTMFDAGQRGVINSDSWIEQAKLAAEGNFQALVQLQKADGSSSKLETSYPGLLTASTPSADDTSDNDTTADGAIDTATDKTSAQSDSMDFSRLKAENLQVIEGIGPAMEKILHSNGIHSWHELAEKTAADVRTILDTYGDKYKGVEHLDFWIEQAQLAASGDFEKLVAIQKVDGVSKLERKFAGILRG